MNVDGYTLEEFLRRTENLHGYAAPGVLAGGYLVAKAKRQLPPGCLFEVVCESAKCLPDAVQLLTVCSTGSGRLWIRDNGRYAVTLFDKYTFAGYRANLDLEALKDYPEYEAWFLKQKPKNEQDYQLLMDQIAQAGESVCSISPVMVDKSAMNRISMGPVAICPLCREAFPAKAGNLCLSCQGEAQYLKHRVMTSAPIQSGQKSTHARLSQNSPLPLGEANSQSSLLNAKLDGSVALKIGRT